MRLIQQTLMIPLCECTCSCFICPIRAGICVHINTLFVVCAYAATFLCSCVCLCVCLGGANESAGFGEKTS